ncbi:hypothetical protein GUJ93_ZPchr0002g26126 [Zizania palustris]|uniref:ENT domain-containing protein n=1 Tax=Zizania palustris TaxID=103762 RepID=A0A8J5V9N1_ZIZPA|nr:hypothetical protein GUJ93_ZPchr0002g26126 [Zizania palustris]
MDYGEPSDSSGTDDDLPPPYPSSRGISGSGRVSGNGRGIVAASSYPRVHTDMETQIHQLEQEAYCSVLRAFKAQSDAITWEKESLITELRKELRVSDKDHRELLNRVNNDDIIRSIRERRSSGGPQAMLPTNPQPIHDVAPSPTTSGPKKGVSSGTKGKKTKPGQKVPGGSSVKGMPSSAGPSGRVPHMNRNFSGGHASFEPSEAQDINPLINRKVMTRWPEDNNFYEATITDYNPETDIYALAYDMNTANESWEWVDLKQMGPEDIRWQGDDPGIYQGGRGGPGSGGKKTSSRGGPTPGTGRGRGFPKHVSRKDLPPQNGVGKRSSDDIDILHTESLIKEVERVFSVSNPDPLEVEKAKKTLKEQEQSLIDAIGRLAEASDGESDEHNRVRRNAPYAGNQHQANYAGAMAVDGGHMVGGAADAG